MNRRVDTSCLRRSDSLLVGGTDGNRFRVMSRSFNVGKRCRMDLRFVPAQRERSIVRQQYHANDVNTVCALNKLLGYTHWLQKM